MSVILMDGSESQERGKRKWDVHRERLLYGLLPPQRIICLHLTPSPASSNFTPSSLGSSSSPLHL